jgi:hypothetical protein
MSVVKNPISRFTYAVPTTNYGQFHPNFATAMSIICPTIVFLTTDALIDENKDVSVAEKVIVFLNENSYC